MGAEENEIPNVAELPMNGDDHIVPELDPALEPAHRAGVLKRDYIAHMIHPYAD